MVSTKLALDKKMLLFMKITHWFTHLCHKVFRSRRKLIS
jgi:hypothetical protein